MLPLLSIVKGATLDVFFPKRCVGCGREGEFICLSCQHTIGRIYAPFCPLCGRPQPSGVLCPSCVKWQAAISGIRSPFRFSGVIREAVHQLKYNNLREISVLLSGFLEDYLRRYPIPCDILVPVPLHPKRLRERGYNQSGLLANKLSKLTGIPVSESCLIRSKYSPSQAKTNSVQERLKNVSGIFDIKDNTLKGRDILLIDDVSTSGATLNECALALKAGGAASVWGLVLAREI